MLANCTSLETFWRLPCPVLVTQLLVQNLKRSRVLTAPSVSLAGINRDDYQCLCPKRLVNLRFLWPDSINFMVDHPLRSFLYALTILQTGLSWFPTVDKDCTPSLRGTVNMGKFSTICYYWGWGTENPSPIDIHINRRQVEVIRTLKKRKVVLVKARV